MFSLYCLHASKLDALHASFETKQDELLTEIYTDFVELEAGATPANPPAATPCSLRDAAPAPQPSGATRGLCSVFKDPRGGTWHWHSDRPEYEDGYASGKEDVTRDLEGLHTLELRHLVGRHEIHRAAP